LLRRPLDTGTCNSPHHGMCFLPVNNQNGTYYYCECATVYMWSDECSYPVLGVVVGVLSTALAVVIGMLAWRYR